MGSGTAVGIDDDFSPCESCVCCRSPEGEEAGGIDEEPFFERSLWQFQLIFLKDGTHEGGEDFAHLTD